MKRLLAMIMIFVVALLLGTTVAMAKEPMLTDEDFTLQIHGRPVPLLGDVKTMNNMLGEAFQFRRMTIEVPLSRHEYQQTHIYTDDNNRIVCMASEWVKTSRGILTHESSIADVKATYGEPDREKYSEQGCLLVYVGPGAKKMLFYFSKNGGTLSQIQVDVFPFSGLLNREL